MEVKKIIVDGVSYIREECSSLKVLDSFYGNLYCNICGCLVPVSSATRKDVKRNNLDNGISEPYMITGHTHCVDKYEKRC